MFKKKYRLAECRVEYVLASSCIHLYFWGFLLKSLFFVIHKATTQKKEVSFCQKSIGVIRCSLATPKDAGVGAACTTKQSLIYGFFTKLQKFRSRNQLKMFCKIWFHKWKCPKAEYVRRCVCFVNIKVFKWDTFFTKLWLYLVLFILFYLILSYFFFILFHFTRFCFLILFSLYFLLFSFVYSSSSSFIYFHFYPIC